jgi:hypothetical protein
MEQDTQLAPSNIGGYFHKTIPVLWIFLCVGQVLAQDPNYLNLQPQQPGDHTLYILSPRLLELELANTKQPDPAHVDSWDWVDSNGNFSPPNLSGLRVVVNGKTNTITAIGFKRRPFYAPLDAWDLRIGNHLYLQLANDITNGGLVHIYQNVWPTNIDFTTQNDPLRYNPAIHVNEEGYLPGYPKKAMVGYYLGNLGEMPILTNIFYVVNRQTGATVYQGALTLRPDSGYEDTPLPYQNVYQADFSSYTNGGEYRIVVPGMGGSLPFRIDNGVAMAFARTYAQGAFEQRSAFNVALPFTRFTHLPDHTAPALVPSNNSAPYAFTWTTIANYATQVNSDNPPQTAPTLNSPTNQLYPFVSLGPIPATGGHFEAGDYNRVTYNGAQFVHYLMFAVDSLTNVGALDNLGIAESGDGISDLLQEAKWEADFLAKMQDTDGGFYYARYPQNREYENDVLPENGDPEVVWPKNTVSTAASVAALAECASSPRFKSAYPQVAANYLAKALLGWRFLTNAINTNGLNGAYQEIQHFGDFSTDHDDLAWAACALYLATGDTRYRDKLFAYYPNPTDYTTFKWGWWRMFEGYGCAARDYAFAVRSGRLSSSQIDQSYLAACVTVITNCGDDNLLWSQHNAYGSSFPDTTKGYNGGGWYFSAVQAFDIVVAYQWNPRPEYLDAILANLNYEGGCNPINQAHLTGVGWKRQFDIVDQYSANDRRVMPKNGMPIGDIIVQFYSTWTYQSELGDLTFPSDYASTNTYPFYDRWCDDWNVSTEASTTDIGRSLVVAAWLAAQTPLATQHWTFTNATIIAPTSSRLPNQPVTVGLQVADTNLNGTRIVWEAMGQVPSFGGTNYTFTPGPNYGAYWVEAEVQWPDGRRAYATNSVNVSPDSPSVLSGAQWMGAGGFSFQVAGTPGATYIILVSTNLHAWSPLSTNQLSNYGLLKFTDPQAPGIRTRFYRALKR